MFKKFYLSNAAIALSLCAALQLNGAENNATSANISAPSAEVVNSAASKNASGANATKLGTIVVTATGFEDTLKNEVRNVSVITAEDMENRGYRDLREILEKAPGVSFHGDTVDLRGQGQKANTSVKVLLNGVALNMIDTTPTPIPINLVPIEDIERVEIIPGGGSVLYGSGTSGGVINIITKKGARYPYANVSTKIASYNYKDLNFGAGGNVSENLFLKTAIKGFDQHGYRKGERERGYYTSFGLNYKISDDQSLSFNPSFYRARTHDVPSLGLVELKKDRRQQGGERTFTKSTRLNFDLDYAVKFGDIFEANLQPYYQDIRILQKGFVMKDRKEGANLKGKLDYDSGEFITGYDYLKNKGFRRINFDAAMNPMMSLSQLTIFDMQKLTHSVYALEKHNFTDLFSLSAGGRFERAEYKVDREVSTTMRRMGRIFHTQDSTHVTDHKNNYAFEITPNFNYSKDGNLYFKFERGYISPGPNQLIDKLGRNGPYVLNNLKSETFKTYEIGLKDLIYGQYVSATIFWTDTKNEIVNETLGSSITDGWHFINIDETRRKGVELYAEQSLLSNLKLSETFSYVDAKIQSGADKGKQVPLVERSKFVLGLDYEPIRNLTLMSDFKYFSSSHDANHDRIDSRTIVDLGAAYRFASGFLISAGVKNVFDEEYNYNQNLRADVYTPAPGRNYYVEFKYAY
nr:TonB-dependent receptor [uncultured Campylobacter sp.]